MLKVTNNYKFILQHPLDPEYNITTTFYTKEEYIKWRPYLEAVDKFLMAESHKAADRESVVTVV